jgi:hypothetical protein
MQTNVFNDTNYVEKKFHWPDTWRFAATVPEDEELCCCWSSSPGAQFIAAQLVLRAPRISPPTLLGLL